MKTPADPLLHSLARSHSKEPGAGSRPDSFAEPKKDDMLRDLDAQIAAIAEMVASQRSAGADEASLGNLRGFANQLKALRGQVETAASPQFLMQLRGRMSAAMTAAAGAVILAPGATAASAGSAALRMASAETQRLLGRNSGQISERSEEMSDWGQKYGIDLTEHQKREMELKRQEQELRDKGDFHGALGIHADRLRHQIGGYSTLLDSDKLSDADRRKIEERRKQAEDDLQASLREQERLGKGKDTGQAEQQGKDDRSDVKELYGPDDKRSTWELERRTDLKAGQASARMSLRDDSTSVSAGQAEVATQGVTTEVKKAMGQALGAAFELGAPDDVKAQARLAAAPAASAGAQDSSRTADLSTSAKPAPTLTADTHKPPAGRGTAP
ncbi:hypothetical protein KHC28_01315 [Ancylobacter sonchi]|uniref:hypothetical protein n=1 Tax=Ancylobacter sonchi TaxID=1937790 RepID=UPI001BD1DC9A|nr:hypothetical protein [Ancylobacter sonchi]MBS7532292.1 hypothetical protein [Ancylobacter sonchi]